MGNNNSRIDVEVLQETRRLMKTMPMCDKEFHEWTEYAAIELPAFYKKLHFTVGKSFIISFYNNNYI